MLSEEKHHRGDSKTNSNEDGSGRRRWERIGNDDFEKLLKPIFSTYMNDDMAPLNSPVLVYILGKREVLQELKVLLNNTTVTVARV